MLIQLKSINRVLNACEKDLIKKAFHMIVDSEFLGANLILVDDPPEDYDISAFEESFGPLIASTLSKIRSRYTENLVYLNLTSEHVIIDFTYPSKYKSVESESAIHLSFDWILNSHLSKPSVLILEDLNDQHVYQLCLEYFQHEESLQKYSINLSFEHGGGGSTFRVFNHYIQRGYNVLCIVDSDRRHPGGPLGQTAQKFSGTPRYDAVYKLEVLTLHEAENLIPIPLHKKSYEVIQEHRRVEQIEEVEEILMRRPDSVNYFDFKKGLSVYHATKLDKQYGIYWGSFVTDKILGKCLACMSALSNFEKDSKGVYRCTYGNPCKILNSLCSDSAATLAKLNEHSLDINVLITQAKPQYENQVALIHKIGALLFSWGLSGNFESSS